MKNKILYFSLLILITSCTSLNYDNFNKRKYLNLKLKSSYTSVSVDSKNDKAIDVIAKNIDANYEVVANVKNEHEVITNIILQENNTTIESNQGEVAIQPKAVEAQHIIKTTESIKRHATKNSLRQSHKKSKSGLLYFSILLAVPFMLKYKKGRQISKWASKNIKKAQLLIGVFTLTGIGSSYLLGNVLQLNISNSMFIVPFVFGAIGVALYKTKTSSISKYLKERSSFTLINISTFFGSFAFGSYSSYSLLTMLSQDPNKMIVHPAIAIIVTIILIALLCLSVYGLAMLACTLSCNGYGLLAILVLTGGSYLAAFLATLGILHLFKKHSEKDKRFGKEAALKALLALFLVGIFFIIISEYL